MHPCVLFLSQQKLLPWVKEETWFAATYPLLTLPLVPTGPPPKPAPPNARPPSIPTLPCAAPQALPYTCQKDAQKIPFKTVSFQAPERRWFRTFYPRCATSLLRSKNHQLDAKSRMSSTPFHPSCRQAPLFTTSFSPVHICRALLL